MGPNRPTIILAAQPVLRAAKERGISAIRSVGDLAAAGIDLSCIEIYANNYCPAPESATHRQARERIQKHIIKRINGQNNRYKKRYFERVRSQKSLAELYGNL